MTQRSLVVAPFESKQSSHGSTAVGDAVGDVDGVDVVGDVDGDVDG